MNANVRILKSSADYDINYTYIVPDELSARIDVGVFVRVPFGKWHKETIGIVTELDVDYKEKFELKAISAIEEELEPLDGDYLNLADMMAKRYICNVTDCYRTMQSPIKLDKIKHKFVKLAISAEKIEEIINTNEIRKIAQLNILKLLQNESDRCMEQTELLRITEGKTADITALKKKEYICIEETETREVATLETENCVAVKQKALDLNSEQESAFNGIMTLVNRNAFGEFLLHGITGSGKTEIYLHLIDELLKRDEGAILLVPEIALTAQMIKRVTDRFGENVVVLHSRISAPQKTRAHMLLRSGRAKIAMGVRSCVFAPVKKLKMIIVDEAQEPSYKSFESLPFYNAVEVAAMRMKIANGVVVYGSATPCVTAFYRAKKGQIGYKYLGNRATNSELPKAYIVDMKKESNAGNYSPISKLLREELAKNHQNGEQSIIFVPRRGFAGRLVCLGCGKTIGCPHCHTSVTYHKGANRVVCHYCGETVIAPTVCPACKSSNLSAKSVGTEKVEEELSRLFPGAAILRMDTDTTKTTREGHSVILNRFEKENVPFLVGTQMIAKGLDYPNVTLVGVIGADSLVSMPDYDAEERAFVLLTQVFGRAGRGEGKPGRCILQTLDPENEIYAKIASQNYFQFYETEIQYREMLDFPPFASMSTQVLYGADDRATFDRLTNARKLLENIAREQSFDDIEIFGVNRSRIPKINDKYYWEFTVKSHDKEKLTEILNEFRKQTLINCDLEI